MNEKNQINWDKPAGPDNDINTDSLPKSYPQFSEQQQPQQTKDPNGVTRYVEFDERAILNEGEFINDNEPFDLIELPSKGYFYRNKKDKVRVGYLTAADENIITSPNLIQNGRMIDVLLRKKIKDKDVSINELLPGDKQAILIFLRATGYGHEYPITLTDPLTGEEFEYVVNLNDLKYKEIIKTPNEKGEFEFTLPKCKDNVMVRLLSEKDQQEIDEILEQRRKVYGESNISIGLTSRLERSIMEINGNRDKSYISEYIQQMLAFDSLSLRGFIKKLEPGVDLTLNIKAPSGEMIKTELPFNRNFFWPQL